MNTAELHKAAQALLPPVGATAALAVVDGSGAHRAAWLIGGRLKSAPVGPSFERPRDACRFVDIVNGVDPTPRPGRRGVTAQTEVPASDPSTAVDASCADCGGILPGRPGKGRSRRCINCEPEGLGL